MPTAHTMSVTLRRIVGAPPLATLLTSERRFRL